MTAQPADISMFTGEVHPYAAAFPMLPDADLDALAADIKANGLAHPLVLTPDGALLDGRNRLAACDRCGVKPDFVVYDGDPIGYVITVNMQRRDLTQGQKAHLAVAGHSDSKLESKEIAAIAGIPSSRIAEAGMVRQYAPEASRAVIEGRLTHSAAYDAAKTQKKSDEESKLQRATLEAEAPDLLSLDLAEAWAAYLKRTEKERERAAAIAQNIREQNRRLTEAVFYLHLHGLNPDMANNWLATYDPADAIHPSTRDEVDAAIAALTAIRKGLRK